MDHIKRKLLMTGLSLTISVVMIVTASLAWMTISTKPEVSGIQVSLYMKQTLLSSLEKDKNYVQHLEISDQFADLAPLRPTSTLDGKNWFIPTYDDRNLAEDPEDTYDGSLNEAADFILDKRLEYANVSTKNLSGDELRAAIEKGYYVYTDFYLKTEETACNVRLSVPGTTPGGESGSREGSYVLAGREQMTVEGSRVGMMSARQTESCVRVGFLFEVEDPDTKEKTERFVIYEPNADQRSKIGDKPTESNAYVLGYQYDSDTYADENYIKTQPIGVNAEGKGEVKDIPSDRLIIQKKSAWKNTDTVRKKFEDKAPLFSNDVDIFGKFISAESISAAVQEDLPEGETASDILLQLKQDTPVKVRLFIWLEGQDVDCWNDIAAGSIIVNLELSGETIYE